MPEAWRAEWMALFRAERERARKAEAEVKKTLALIPEIGRRDFIGRNRASTKLSLSKLYRDFVRQKESAAREAEKDFAAYDGEDVPDVGGWGERYPGSPSDLVMAVRAADCPEPERFDADRMARQRKSREYVKAHERLPLDLRMMAVGLA
jgi:hypothetical protein